MAVGLWLIGARGSIGTTVTAGLALLTAGPGDLAGIGMVSELPQFADLGLPAVADLVVGGHDLSDLPMKGRAEELVQAGVLPAFALPLVRPDLEAVDARVRPGVAGGGRAAIEQVQRDLREFAERHALDTVVVVNIASTEPIWPSRPEHADLAGLDRALDAGAEVLAPSALYAYAALDAGLPFIDFTPSMGAAIPALDELARSRGTVYAGRDGKTGETLVKTALAPMFGSRNLRVTSWSGLNLLGGGDGRVLADPERAAAKLASKARSVRETFGDEVTAPVHIDYVEDMGEWKTAWNQVRFTGFLGTRMTMQITWQGCDSALAAPLVIDLARFTARARLAGRTGVLHELGFFFKDPLGSSEHRLDEQFRRLVSWAGALRADSLRDGGLRDGGLRGDALRDGGLRGDALPGGGLRGDALPGGGLRGDDLRGNTLRGGGLRSDLRGGDLRGDLPDDGFRAGE
ncbi:inositol-3-phosphate synthase [Kineosporia sp. J2-2]|uniref:Inositol-3-phosphate synthase n=1 Tax=Kineosporia corallincola TaxID=2835133 RepID=A0ABS5TAV4_9ACTN|nr:inositol-3-phosphate synthase [Kineosporia corallincola]MBT0767579.1 inositol-3-phosphate synthase [Kineosporia corallincola]